MTPTTVLDHTAPTQREARSARTLELFRQAHACPGTAQAEHHLQQVVELNVGMADALATRYRRRGVDDEDLAAVARLALVKAARRFRVDAGHDFASFAAPTIRGEIKRYFRDNGWMVRPPRRIQELQSVIATVEGRLQHELGRSPRPSELADALDLEVDDVEEALSARGCFFPSSLDAPTGEDGSATLGDTLVADDAARGAADARVILGPLVRRLDERDRRILQLRFYDGLTQREIADDIGVTQMQVSRLLSRILLGLREACGETDERSTAVARREQPR